MKKPLLYVPITVSLAAAVGAASTNVSQEPGAAAAFF